MASKLSLLQLPDLVLYKICSFITCPFDLLYFGNSCTRLRKISLSQSLWWSVAFQWCKGMWIYMKDNSEKETPREWLLDILQHYTIPSSGTVLKCIFADGEIWEREESCKLRCIFGMLRLAYMRDKDDHPAVLYEQWLYDIGLYRRISPQIDFSLSNFEFSEDMILQFTSLGQAIERDLRRRKQPNKDPKYYIKRVGVAGEKWMVELFPSGPHGSICPLLMCHFQDAVTNEVSGLQGLAVCLSLVLEQRLKVHCKSVFLPLRDIFTVIKIFCTIFIKEVTEALPGMESRLGSLSLKSAVLTLIEEKAFNTEQLQNLLDTYKLVFSCKDVLSDISDFLQTYEGIDFIVDMVRLRLREAMLDEINNVLHPSNFKTSLVTRINLTDSDLIGGDNSRQEMSSAAFVSNYGVLVTWHLTGRMRY